MSTVREATYELLRARGMTTIFGNPGSTELPMLDGFPDDFHYVLGLQEAVAVRQRINEMREPSAAELVQLGQRSMSVGQTAAATDAFERARRLQGDAFRHEVNALDASNQQVAAVVRFFDTLAGKGERLAYCAKAAAIVDAHSTFLKSRQASQRGGEALAA